MSSPERLLGGCLGTVLNVAVAWWVLIVLDAVREALGIRGFGIGAATFFGPPAWWIAVRLVIATLAQVIAAAALWWVAFELSDRLSRRRSTAPTGAGCR